MLIQHITCDICGRNGPYIPEEKKYFGFWLGFGDLPQISLNINKASTNTNIKHICRQCVEKCVDCDLNWAKQTRDILKEI